MNPAEVQVTGSATTNDNQTDISAAIVHFGTITQVHPTANGVINTTLYEGLYDINATLNYYFPINISNYSVNNNGSDPLNLVFNRMPYPTNLTYSLAGNAITLSWHFANQYPELFQQFRVLAGSNNNANIQMRVTSDTTVVLDNLVYGRTYYFRIQASYQGGNSSYSNVIQITPTAINDNNQTALVNEITNIAPNPFNPSTEIKYTLQKEGSASLVIFNAKGQLIRQYAFKSQNAGSHSLIWNGCDNKNKVVSSGIYFCKLTTGEKESCIRKMVLMK